MQSNGRWLVSGMRDGVEVNVVIEQDGQVCTSFPAEGGEGVVRNPRRGRQ